MTLVLILALVIVCAALLIHIISIRIEMKKLCEELSKTRELSYNRQMSVALIDRELENLTVELNKNIDYQKSLKLRSERAELNLKRSVSDIAHDLRTPLTVIKGTLRMLEKEEKLGERGREYIRICMAKADSMKEMADEFFELSLLESDNSAVPVERVNVTNLLMQFLADNEPVIRAHGIEPEVIFPEKSVFVQADEDLLMRMLGNLLNNVIKYSHEGFTLSMEIVSENRCAISFANVVKQSNAPDITRIFDRTYRADNARKGGGSGLGLYIVKLLAERQGAEVSATYVGDLLKMSILYNIAD